MDEEAQLSRPKISEVEIVGIGLLYFIFDLVDLIPVAGDITDVVAAPMGLYYWMKGINGITFLVAEVLDLIPGIQEIPSRTIGWGITVWLDRHPKLEARLATVTAVAGALEGDVEEMGEGSNTLESIQENRSNVNHGGSSQQDLNMTQPEAGAREHQPESTNGRGEENTKPSEKNTERDSAATQTERGESVDTNNSSEYNGQGMSDGKSEEDEKNRQFNEDIMETDVQRPPMEKLEKDLLPRDLNEFEKAQRTLEQKQKSE